ncbi:sensor histidine kinase [Aquibacillus kalidii]|uniref:sensor histidine kinase n=1 Tax=Aquibacillus kalidii TaxID=2762597 RepID=UPI00164708D6|nr:sensor histidine kinase [Aquibacillus kalidii]
MQNWYHIFPKNTGLSLYIWIIFCILPFYFIFRSSIVIEIVFGIVMIILFFLSYRLSFISKGGLVYICLGIEMIISVIMTLFFGYVYFSLFLAFFIGNIQKRAGFITLYVVHLITTIAAIVVGFIMKMDAFFPQLPFIIISIIGVILMPFNMFNRIKQEKLEGELEVANKKVSQMALLEERQRIARDLHDTLGQKLSLIGLKSDLASKLIQRNPDSAISELNDIRQTARTALKEVREMVSEMRGARLKDELIHVEKILDAAEIDCHVEGNPILTDTPLLVENVLSMCLKEAVTNIVKHSQASICFIHIEQSTKELLIQVKDNGIGMDSQKQDYQGNGLIGMKERLEFVNGSLSIDFDKGTTLLIKVPNIIKQIKEED